MLRRFDVLRAGSIEEAIDLRTRSGDDAAVYAGGTELLMTMKLGVTRYARLIDVKPIDALRRVEVRDGTLRIGATVTHREIEHDANVVRRIPALARLERNVANVRVRATGTIGGNLAFAEPHADPPALLAALGARVIVRGPAGERAVAMDDFITGMYQTSLGADEILAAVEVPFPAADVRVAYVKFQILERPSVGVAIAAAVRDGAFRGAPAVVIGAVDEMPRRVPTAALAGARIDDARAADALAEAARGAVGPVADLAGSAEYKRHLVGVFARRALAALTAEAA